MVIAELVNAQRERDGTLRHTVRVEGPGRFDDMAAIDAAINRDPTMPALYQSARYVSARPARWPSARQPAHWLIDLAVSDGCGGADCPCNCGCEPTEEWHSDLRCACRELGCPCAALDRPHIPGTDYYDGRDGSIEAEDDDEDRIAEQDALMRARKG